jgi:hypothetical protein
LLSILLLLIFFIILLTTIADITLSFSTTTTTITDCRLHLRTCSHSLLRRCHPCLTNASLHQYTQNSKHTPLVMSEFFFAVSMAGC